MPESIRETLEPYVGPLLVACVAFALWAVARWAWGYVDRHRDYVRALRVPGDPIEVWRVMMDGCRSAAVVGDLTDPYVRREHALAVIGMYRELCVACAAVGLPYPDMRRCQEISREAARAALGRGPGAGDGAGEGWS